MTLVVADAGAQQLQEPDGEYYLFYYYLYHCEHGAFSSALGHPREHDTDRNSATLPTGRSLGRLSRALTASSTKVLLHRMLGQCH
jgi:hypothetical protein